MKQIPLSPEIITKIQAVAGVDVSTEGLAVFEANAISTRPITGKDGTLFEGAVLTPLTLREMADYINTKGLPLAEDHITSGAALGKVFNAEVQIDTAGTTLSGELTTMFYLDPTESVRITKLNAGSIDEVSINFLGSKLLCSECGWDFRGEDSDSYDNIYKAVCGNGHAIGVEGTHLIISGLDKFKELSLVQLGAASNAKIVGKSVARLPANKLQMAAAFETDGLFVTASQGDKRVDIEVLLTKLSDTTVKAATAEAALTVANAKVTAAEAALAAETAKVTDLTSRLAVAETAKNETAATELTEARAVLTAQFTALAIANGEKDPVAPETIAELKAGIDERTTKLTALIPVGGASQAAGDPPKTEVKRDYSAFKTAK